MLDAKALCSLLESKTSFLCDFRNVAASSEYVQTIKFPPEAEIFFSLWKPKERREDYESLGSFGAIFGGVINASGGSLPHQINGFLMVSQENLPNLG